MNLCRLKMRRAFSLVEMLVVIVIIGILLALMLPVFAGAIEKARKVGKPVDSSDLSSHVLRPTSVRH
jgi:prepilin-type N-terminal cleavage/methylation domain-containing protein